MARAYQQTGIAPERRLARLLVERLNLSMPVDVRSVAAGIAELEEVALPLSIDCDGVAILTTTPPRIVVNSRRPVVRQRFTLAHEIGHVMIPWHVGGSICQPLNRLRSPGTSGPEGEANIFASELLVPRRQLEVVGGTNLIEDRLKLARSAKVSDEAAMRAVGDTLGPGHALCLTDRTGTVIAVSVSPGTYTPTPYPRQKFDSLYLKGADSHGQLRIGSRDLWWWHLAAPTRPRQPIADRSTETLRLILEDIAPSGSPEYRKLQQSINGTIGSANSRTPLAEADSMVALFRQRFNGRPQLDPVVSHSLFSEFIWSKAEELAERRRGTE